MPRYRVPKYIPLDNVYTCSWRSNARHAAMRMFWRDLQIALDATQAAYMDGKLLARCAPGEHVRVDGAPFEVGANIETLQGLPSVKIDVLNSKGKASTSQECMLDRHFSLRVQTAWQRDAILAHLKKWSGKTFRFDMGAKGHGKRRISTQRRMATQANDF